MSEYRHELKKEENAKIKLTIHVPQDTVASIYEKTIKSISKKIQLKGFRKGKVPLEILEQRFGDSLRAEATEKIINESVQKVIEHVEYKPLMYSQFNLENKNENEDDDDTQRFIINPAEEFTFTISYDTYPEVELTDFKELSLPKYTLAVSNVDLDTELKEIQKRNILYADTETPLELGQEATISVVELDENNNEIEDTKKQDLRIILGENALEYNITDDILGMKKDDEKIITKSYPKDYEYTHLAEKSIQLKIAVQRIRSRDIPAIDDELAKDVSDKFNSLDELKQEITRNITLRAENLIEDLYRSKILKYITSHSSIDLPESAVNYQLDHNWQNFIQRSGENEQQVLKNLSLAGMNKEKLYELWRPNVEVQVREQIAIQKMLEDEHIEISTEDFENRIRQECEHTGENFDEAMKYYNQDPQIIDQIKHNMKLQELLNKIKKITIVDKETKLSFTELMKLVNEEQNNERELEQE